MAWASLGIDQLRETARLARARYTFYGSCDVVVLTSPRVSIEGSPNALLEAMAMARPIVATRVGGVPELVRDRIDGFLAEPDDVEGFSAHLQLLLEHPGLRSRMGASGRRRVTESFCSDDMIKHLGAVLRQVARPERNLRPVPIRAQGSGP